MSEKTRTELMRELLEADVPKEQIIDRVVATLDDAQRKALVRTMIMTELAQLISRESRFSRGAITSRNGRNLPPKQEVSRDKFFEYAGTFFDGNEDPGDRLSRRADLLVSSFTVPQVGRIVRWGEATIEDHRLRKEYCEKIAFTASDSAHMHARAISEITAAKVRTLNEIVKLRHSNVKAIEAAA